MKIIKALLIFTIISFFLGCPNPFETKSKVRNSEVEIKLNTDSLGIQNSRTFLPTAPTVSKFIVGFNGNKTIDPIVITSLSKYVSLPDGTWTITVNAYSPDNKIVGIGSKVIIIPDDSSITIDVLPTITELGSGSIDIDLEYTLPASLSVTGITASCLSIVDDTVIDMNVVKSGDSAVISKDSIPSGSYIFFIEFTTDNGSLVSPYSEVIQIYDNIVTSASVTLGSSHFNTKPSNPTNLTVLDNADGVLLNWNCSANNETGFVIERKVSGQEYSTLEELTGYNVTSYSDTTTVDGTSYSYRVYSKNSVGNSDFSNEINVTISSEARVLYVKTGGTGNGTSWDNAFGHPQQAIDSSATYTRKPQVWIAQGVYKPINSPSNPASGDPKEYHFSLRPGVSIYGGFAGTETDLSQRDYINNSTIFSGDYSDDDEITGVGFDLRFNNLSDNAESIFLHESSLFLLGNEVIDGFIITGGNNSNSGAGLRNYKNDFTIRNCKFIGNYSSGGSGGAIYTGQSNLVIENSIFDSNGTNYNYHGGAIYMYYSDIIVKNSIFYNNSIARSGSGYRGGALYISSGSDVKIYNSMFVKNTARTGGAIYFTGRKLEVFNSIFTDNRAIDDTNSIYLNADNASVIDSTIDSYTLGCTTNRGEWGNIVERAPLLKDIDNPKGDDGIWLTTDDGLQFSNGSLGIDFIVTNDFVTESDIHSTIRGDKPDLGPYESEYDDVTAPGLVSNIVVEELNGAVKLSWENPIDNDYKLVEVQWNSILNDSGEKQSLINENSIIIGELENNTEYTFKLTSIDFAGNRSSLSEVTGSPIYKVVPDVTDLQLTSSNSRIVATWKDPLDTVFQSVDFIIEDNNNIHTFSVEPGIEILYIDDLWNSDFTVSVKVKDYGNQESTGVVTGTTTGPILYVDSSATGLGDGSSWVNASPDLTRAMKYANRNTDIWVAKGTYIPTENMSRPDKVGERYNHFSLPLNVNLYGGFAGNEINLENRDFKNNVTILSGDINQNDIITGSGRDLKINNNTENLYNVIYLSSNNVSYGDVIIDGFTITGGNADVSYSGGGAINTYEADINIRNCVFYGNESKYTGGAVYFNGSRNSGPVIENSIFFNNRSDSRGGALGFNSPILLKNILFFGNYTENGGGAIFNSGYYGVNFYNLTIVDNYSKTDGAAIYNDDTNFNLYNSIVNNNQSSDGIEIYSNVYNGTEDIGIYNSIMKPTGESCEVDNETNLIVENLYYPNIEFFNFNNPIGDDNLWFTNDDGYQLKADSIGIELGDSSYAVDIVKDIKGDSRIQGKTVDIGAYESNIEDITPPDEVSSIVKNNLNGTIEFSWVDPTNVDFRHVEISWTPADGPAQPKIVEKGTNSASITGLIEGTEYTYTIKTVDLSGNASAGIEIDDNNSGLSIFLNAPQEESITLSQMSGVIISYTSTLSISILEYFDSYTWYLDGDILAYEDYSLNLPCSNLTLGTHRLMCVVSKNGEIYSKNIIFEVSNN